MAEVVSSAAFLAMSGKELPPSSWLEITQARVNQFAEATNDHQFIHTDPQRAASSVFEGTIAHGFLTLSLLSFLMEQSAVVPENMTMAVNYGSDKVRYLTPVRVGKRIRARSMIIDVEEKRPNNWLVKTKVTIEIEDESTPALIAEILSLYVVAAA